MTEKDFFMLQKYNIYRFVQDGIVTSDIVYAKNPKGAKFLARWNRIKYDFIVETKLVKE